MEATRIGIVNARGTDGYSLIYEYEDGTQSSPHGWFATVEAARAAVEPDGEYADQYAQVPVEDWTE
jgi:hypothetical protein